MLQYLKDFFAENQLLRALFGFLAFALVFVAIYYFATKDSNNAKKHGRKSIINLDLYEEKIILYNNFPQCRKHYLKFDLIPFVLCVVGIVCVLISFNNALFADLDLQLKLFYVGLVVIGLCLVYYAVRFLLNGGLKGLLQISDSSHLQYIKPEYETHNVYETEDGVTKGRLVDSYTRESNGATEQNVVTFILKCVAIIFKILTLIDFAFVYMIDRFIGAVKFVIFGLAVKSKLLADATAAYEKFLLYDDVNIGSFNPSRDGIVPIEPYNSSEYNALPQSIVTKLLSASMENVKKGTKSFVFCGKISPMHVLVTKVTNYETSFTMNGNVRHLLSCDKGKLIVDTDAGTVMPLLYDMELYMQFFSGDNFNEAVEMIKFGATHAQYCWLKKLMATQNDNYQVQLLCFRQDGKSYYVKAKLKDITLNEQSETYVINQCTQLDAKKTIRSAKTKRLWTSMIWPILLLLFLLADIIYLVVTAKR